MNRTEIPHSVRNDIVFLGRRERGAGSARASLPNTESNCHFERSEKSLSLLYVQRQKTNKYFLVGGFSGY